MDVYAELLSAKSPCGLAIWKSSIKEWRPPHNREAINGVQREAIVENSRRAIRFLGDDIEVIG
jgi:hypothetical protein